MLKLVLTIALATTYAEWFIRTYELRAVYPFDKTHVLPVDAGESRLSEVILKTDDGETLVLWISPPDPESVTILYLPGNAGNLANRTARFSYFLDQGVGLVAMAYRGSSGSSGKPDERVLSRDALQVFDALPDLVEMPSTRIIIYGESLGTAMATKIAVARSADGVVLEAPFTSFIDLGKAQYPNMDLTKILTQIWNTAAIIEGMDEPLLVLHGRQDNLVPFAHGETLFHLAGSQQKWFAGLPDTGHLGIWAGGGRDAIQNFLNRY